MKRLLKRVLPHFLLDRIAKRSYLKRNSTFEKNDIQSVFTSIYNTNHWDNNSSISGPGSTNDRTKSVISGLNSFIEQENISSVMDIPCGDFHWIKQLNFDNISYLGGDIVKELIDSNQRQFGSEKIQFVNFDLTKDSIPTYDLLIIRDCFVHFSFENIEKSISLLTASDVKYVAITNFPKHRLNYNITTGDWRPINMERAPFNFPLPYHQVLEDVDPRYKREFKGKSITIWKVSDLKAVFLVV